LTIEHKTDYVFIMSETGNDTILLTLSCNVTVLKASTVLDYAGAGIPEVGLSRLTRAGR